MNNEALIRLSFFCGTFVIMAIWEAIAPRRMLIISKPLRWINNLSLVVLNTLILRAVLPMAAVGVAAIAKQQGWGLFNLIDLNDGLEIFLSVLLLDLIIYGQHLMFHTLPIFWRLHKVHHADLDFDVTTGLRFHPLEILLSMLIKIIAILLLGTPAIAVLIFETILNSTALFNHGNVHIPKSGDRWLRYLLVTPDMHRVHHSVIPQETNSNYGFSLSWWDYLFRTYRANAAAGQQDMQIGLAEYQGTLKVARISEMLILPFL
ncbi:sterol desaturase family protein [Pseudanabaena sp. FACHB-1277]|jgi:sterol desaturase/sphingolipid hydroxylase (fatty acid hydroxylase superfamily)|uniref:Sterol desaturase family protein n=1 Tax=Pseudanabaena cinerea FACHB-1277 TaxID=2949581 RepID=A0A926USM0_9CYAN|nr:sterol desaturase family protein [Pseudanabaena cinerea]MBD2150113.1 sterol desaturase family protein [Pseudanabaena cinerea FACHB-1277]